MSVSSTQMKNPCSYIFVFGFLSFLLYFVFPIYQAPVNHKRNYVKGKVSYDVRNLVASIKIQLKKKTANSLGWPQEE